MVNLLDLDDEADSFPDNTSSTLPQELILLIFIHGFKGDDKTFLEFPQRLQHLVSETIPNTKVEVVVFPAYETKGELDATVERFADWLATLTVERENANGVGGGAGKAKIVLCGHSMGGIVAADALLGMVNARPDNSAPLWPNIIALLAFDTPYLGLNPSVFKNSATKAINAVQSAHQLVTSLGFFKATTAATATSASRSPTSSAPSIAGAIGASSASSTNKRTSGWSNWAAPAAITLGGLLVSGAAGTAYMKRDDIGLGYKWATDHLTYVGTLWNEPKLNKRMEGLAKVVAGVDEDGNAKEAGLGIVFRNFYTLLPSNPPVHTERRTFAVLPSGVGYSASPLFRHFIAATNSRADDEIEAHTGMFEASSNDGYYSLGLAAATLVKEAIERNRAAHVMAT